MMKSFLCFSVLLNAVMRLPANESQPALVPLPQKMESQSGAFELNDTTAISFVDAAAGSEVGGAGLLHRRPAAFRVARVHAGLSAATK